MTACVGQRGERRLQASTWTGKPLELLNVSDPRLWDFAVDSQNCTQLVIDVLAAKGAVVMDGYTQTGVYHLTVHAPEDPIRARAVAAAVGRFQRSAQAS